MQALSSRDVRGVIFQSFYSTFLFRPRQQAFRENSTVFGNAEHGPLNQSTDQPTNQRTNLPTNLRLHDDYVAIL